MFGALLLSLANKLWQDDCGGVLTSEYLTLGSVVVLGGASGLASMTSAMNDEMREYGRAVGQIRQSYSVAGQRTSAASVSGSSYTARPPATDTGRQPQAQSPSMCDYAP